MWIERLDKQTSHFLFFPIRVAPRTSCFCLSNHGVPSLLTICLSCPVREQLSVGILCLFVSSERHGQLIQLLPEAGELSAAARVLAPSAETQVHAGTSPRPSRPLPALRPLLHGPGETENVIMGDPFCQ